MKIDPQRAFSFVRSDRFGPIGIELALERLHMVQVRNTATGPRIHACASLPVDVQQDALLQRPDALRELIRDGRRSHGFHGDQAVAAMPASQIRVMPVSYQRRDAQSDGAAIAALLRERLGDELDHLVADYMPVQVLRESGGERLALVAVSRREAVLNFLDGLTGAGLDATALEIGPIAIRRLVEVLLRDLPPQNTLILNCGRHKSFVTLIADNRLLADDELEFGEETLLQALETELELERPLVEQVVRDANLDKTALGNSRDAAAESNRALIQILRPQLNRLVEDLQRHLLYASSESTGARLSRVYLLGSFARWAGSDRLLESLLGVPVGTMPNPVALFSDTGFEAGPELAVATGLALKAA
ncbi:MAG: pilus assembly protein PilM [Pseudomonadota bacterium]